MKNHTSTNRKRRFILRAGVCYFGGGMFLLFNYRFIANMHDSTMPYFIFRLIFSGLLFAVGGALAASLVANRFGMKWDVSVAQSNTENPPPCQAKILSATNNQFGTNYTNANAPTWLVRRRRQSSSFVLSAYRAAGSVVRTNTITNHTGCD